MRFSLLLVHETFFSLEEEKEKGHGPSREKRGKHQWCTLLVLCHPGSEGKKDRRKRPQRKGETAQDESPTPK